MEKNILFVDSDNLFLDSLKRMLRQHKIDWKNFYVNSAEEAVKVLSSSKIDIIVSEISLPKMNGLELMHHVSKITPEIVRVIISTLSSKHLFIESSKIAHKIIEKPFNLDEFISYIELVFKQKKSAIPYEAQAILTSIEQLPSPPEIYSKIENLLSTEYEVKDIARLVMQDTALMANLLKLLNSASMGFTSKITDITMAINLLGSDVLKALCINIHSFDTLMNDKIKGYSTQLLQQHTISVGNISKNIAQQLGFDKNRCNEAFMAGALHDIGKLVYYKYFRNTYKVIVDESKVQNKPVWEIEKDIIGISHAEIGAYLLSIWSFDDEIVEGVCYHHAPSLSTDISPKILTCVHIANTVEHNIKILNNKYAKREFDYGYIERIGLSKKINDIITKSADFISRGNK